MVENGCSGAARLPLLWARAKDCFQGRLSVGLMSSSGPRRRRRLQERQRGSSSTTTPTKTGSGELALGLYGERQGGHGGSGLRDVEKGKRSRGTRKASSVRNAVWSSAVGSMVAL